MASRKVAATDEHLPEDIIVQILYRLPVKPLIRFRCVSKRWTSIISDPQFAKSQFKYASERKTLSHRLLLSTSSQLESLDLQTLSFEDDASVRKLTFPFKEAGRAVKILGSCNGMVFAATGLHSLDNCFIWNPTTGLLLKLPNPSYRVGWCPGFPHCGFGYVSATDDYKVVVLDHFRNSTTPVDMYSSKANSWKRIESEPHFSPEDYFPQPKGMFLNEALHWLDRGPGDKPTVIAFDLAKEKFREMPLPLLKQDDEAGVLYSELGVLSGGCLCVACYDDVLFGGFIHVWVMMDYDVRESWTELVKVVDDQLRTPFVYWETSILMLSEQTEEEENPEWNQELVRFDHKEDKLDKVAVCSGRYSLEVGYVDMIKYDESLLWLHDYQGAQNPTQAQKKKKKKNKNKNKNKNKK
ncbi:hypothetical protein M0R45_004808 [Rubus argutus]|uniref:F-box domain-containing protein n=1 Tax=Rubus argutus TaxID=59490 RepID=A0AAW1YKM3_RUBAR